MAKPATKQPADDPQPVGDGWYDKKLDRKVRRLNRSVDGRMTVGEFVSELVQAIAEVIRHSSFM